MHYRKRSRADERTEGGDENFIARPTSDERTVGQANLNSRQNPATKPPPPPKKQQRDSSKVSARATAPRAYFNNNNYHCPRACVRVFVAESSRR
ncbi:MAG: hypothetical protein GY820_46985 [Gammaproteobacteria bacterium]|nr:hypothetical protein [Gammaproteobacteria bacterium]